MSFHTIPLPLFAIGTVLLVLLIIEAGYRIGVAYLDLVKPEKVTTVSTISGSILGLFGFMLAFTFGILYNRFDARKEMIRLEANAIRTVLMRSEFLPEPDHTKTMNLLKDYVTLRIAVVELSDSTFAQGVLRESDRIHQELWDIGIENARKSVSVAFSSLYIQSLNEMMDIHTLRVTRGYQSTAPTGLWLALYSLLFFSMLSIGYQTAIALSRRTLSTLFLAISFSVVIILIYSLDQPNNYFFKVPQQSLKNVEKTIKQNLAATKASIKYP